MKDNSDENFKTCCTCLIILIGLIICGIIVYFTGVVIFMIGIIVIFFVTIISDGIEEAIGIAIALSILLVIGTFIVFFLLDIMGKYFIYTLIGISAVTLSVLLIILGNYFLRYRFNKRNNDKKIQLANKIELLLKEKNYTINLILEEKRTKAELSHRYEGFKPFINLLKKCCNDEVSKIEVLDNMLKDSLKTKYNLNNNKIKEYNYDLMMKEVQELGIDLKVINQKFISKSELIKRFNKYNIHL